MRRFKAEDLKRYLRAVDRHMTSPFQLIVIGGSAALLGYGIDRVTQDIDTWDSDHSRIADALEAAKKETGLNIPVQCPGIHDAPIDFEDRLKTVRIRELTKLAISVPEKHDLVLMKMLRGEQPDMEAADQIKAKSGLDSATLIKRYVEEMRHVVGDIRRLDLNLLALIERLYGAEARDKTRKRLEAHRGHKR